MMSEQRETTVHYIDCSLLTVELLKLEAESKEEHGVCMGPMPELTIT
jgi:hypothetical protein